MTHSARPGAARSHIHKATSLVIGSASALMALVIALPAQAQSSGDSSSMSGRSSFLPYTTSGYAGLNGGVSHYRGGCVPGFGCDNSDGAFKIYTGGMVNQWLGAEVSYLHMGSIDRNGGSTRAHGLNISAVGNIPVSDQFMVYGKIGTTYGRTNTTAPVGLASGSESGWGPSWGVGAGFKITPQVAVVLDWDQHRFDFAGGRDRVAATTAGVRFQF